MNKKLLNCQWYRFMSRDKENAMYICFGTPCILCLTLWGSYGLSTKDTKDKVKQAQRVHSQLGWKVHQLLEVEDEGEVDRTMGFIDWWTATWKPLHWQGTTIGGHWLPPFGYWSEPPFRGHLKFGGHKYRNRFWSLLLKSVWIVTTKTSATSMLIMLISTVVFQKNTKCWSLEISDTLPLESISWYIPKRVTCDTIPMDSMYLYVFPDHYMGMVFSDTLHRLSIFWYAPKGKYFLIHSLGNTPWCAP